MSTVEEALAAHRQPLALKYRPRTFDDLCGQRHVKPILREMVRQGAVPTALLFTGSRGTGKTTSARILAAALNCESDGPRPCLTCHSCQAVASNTSLDVLEVDAASNGNVAEIRKIKDMVQYAVGGQWRVVLLDEAHSMSRDANNALLKVLEEPPPRTIFVLLTTEPSKLLDTVVSRSMTFEFRRLTTADIVSRLDHIATVEGFTVSHDLLTEIATRAQGGMRDAVMSLDQLTRADVKTLEQFREMFGVRDVSTQILRAALDGNHASMASMIDEHFYRVGDAGQMVNDITLLIRDLLVIKSGGTPTLAAECELEERRVLAARVPLERLVAVIKVLWDLKTRVRAIDNDQRAAMEMAAVLIADALRPTVPTTSTSAPATRMSLDSMKAMVGST